MCGVLIVAHGDTQWEIWQSEPDSAYSVDNLPPGAPLNLEGAHDGGPVALDWRSPADPVEDLWLYAVYRSTEPGFSPSSLADTLGVSTDTTYIDVNVDPAETYYYLVSAVDLHGNEGGYSNEAHVGPSAGVAAGDGSRNLAFALHPAAPNPSNPSTEIRFDLPVPTEIRLTVYDVKGARVRELAQGHFPQGSHCVIWDGRDDSGLEAADAVYFLRMTAAGREFKQKLVLLR